MDLESRWPLPAKGSGRIGHGEPVAQTVQSGKAAQRAIVLVAKD
jgi:hypothetical protein